MRTARLTMNTLRAAVMTLALGFASLLHGQGYYELVWDSVVTPAWPQMVFGSTGTTSGGQYLLTRAPATGEMDIHHFNSEGQPVWSKRTAGGGPMTAVHTMASDGGEGLYTARIGSSTEGGVDRIYIDHLDGTGNWTWGRRLDLSDSPAGELILTDVIVLADANGEVDVFIQLYETGEMHWYAWRLDANGNTVRLRSFGTGTLFDLPYFNSADAGDPWRAARATDGGYVIGGDVATSNTGRMFLVRADADGDILWVNRYVIEGASSQIFRGLVMHADGTCEASGLFNTVNGPRIIRILIDVDGSIIQADAYDTPNADLSYGAHSTNDGGSLLFSAVPKVLEIENDGSVVASTRGVNTQVPPSNVGQVWVNTALVNDRLLAGGYVLSTPISFGAITHRPFIGAYATGAALEGCQHEAATVGRESIPLTATTVVTHTPASADLMAYASSEPVLATATELPTPVMLDFCNLVGTDELAGPTGMTLLGNPIQVGEALRIRDLTPGLITVRNSTGALISTGSVSAPPLVYEHRLPTLARGLYHLTWQAHKGPAQRSTTFIVE